MSGKDCPTYFNHSYSLTYFVLSLHLDALTDDSLFVGFATRQQLRQLRNDGDVSREQTKRFYSAVRKFYSTATTYALRNLPINDELLNFDNRSSSTIAEVMFFVSR